MSDNFPPMVKVVLDKTIIIPHSKHHAAGINSVKYSPTGDFIVTGGSDDTIRVYDVAGNEIILFEGHVEPIQSIDIHPIKKIIVSGSEDSTIRLWDLDLKKEIYRFTEAKNTINVVKFSLDGNKLIAGGKDGMLRFYDLESRSLQQEIKTGIITSIAQHPNGELLLVGTANASIIVINIIKGIKVLEIYGHRFPILSLGFSKYNQSGREFLVSSSTDELVKVWDANTFDELISFQAHSGAVNTVKFSPVNTSLATSSYDRSVAIWELEIEAKLATRKQRYYGAKLAFTDLDWSPDGKNLVIVSADGSLRIKSLEDNKDTVVLEKNDTYITAIILSPDNSSFFLGLENGTLMNVNLKGEAIETLEKAHTGTITCIKIFAVTSTRYLVITGSTDKTIKVWDSKSFKIIAIGKNHEGGVRSIAVSPTKEYILTTSTDKTIRKYALKPLFYPPKNQLEINNENKEENKIKESENIPELEKSKDILSYDSSMTSQPIKLDYGINQIPQQTSGETSNLENSDINNESPSVEDLNETLVQQTEKTTIITPDIETDSQKEEKISNKRKSSSKKRTSSKRTSSKRTSSKRTSSKKSMKKVSSIDETKKDDLSLDTAKKEEISTESSAKEDQNSFSFFDMLTEPIELEELKVYTSHTQSVNAIAFSHNGRYFATASNDYTIILHDISKDIPILTYKGHKDHVLSLMFSADDEMLYSGGKDGDIIIHETGSGKIVRILNVHVDAVRTIAECPINKNYFATISDDNSSALFSNYGDKIGQIYFATNPHAIVWDQNEFIYYVTTEIGQLIKIKPITDDITYTFSTTENLAILFTKLIAEIEKIEKESEAKTVTLEQKLYWLNNRILLLEKIKEKSQDPIISQLKRRLEEDLLKYSQERGKNV